MLRIFLAYLLAAFSTALLCSLFSTQFVIADLQAINVPMPFATRVEMTFRDLAILQTLIPAMLGCLLVAFSVAWLCQRLLGGQRRVWYSFAGFAGLVALFLLVDWLLQLMPIAGARTYAGIFCQGVAGGLGGWLFASFAEKPENAIKETNDE